MLCYFVSAFLILNSFGNCRCLLARGLIIDKSRILSTLPWSRSHTIFMAHDSIISHESKFLIPAISSLGIVETGYLTWSKLTSNAVSGAFCSESSSCTDVLTTPYSVIPPLNIPLSLLAFFSYGLIFIFSNQPEFQTTKSELSTSPRASIINGSLLFLTTSMATFSGYLMFLLHFILEASCPYCYLSATLSISLAAIAWKNSIVPNFKQALALGASSVTATLAFSSLLFYFTGAVISTTSADASTAPAAQYLQSLEAGAQNQLQAEEVETGKKPPPVTKPSSAEALALAERLQAAKAKMYGAYWCSHCFNQKQNFGVDAYQKFEYIECDKEGYNSQNAICKANKGVPGYPTWEIYGKYYPGEKSIDELKAVIDELERSRQ